MNIIDRIRLIRPQLNAELSAKQDVRHAGDVFDSVSPHWSDFEASPPSWAANPSWNLDKAVSELNRLANAPGGSFLTPSSWGDLDPSQKAELRRRETRNRPDYISHGGFGTVYSHAPGLVRKEIESRTPYSDFLEEAYNQQLLAESGVGARVHAYERYPDSGKQTIVMQDLRDNYEPVVAVGNWERIKKDPRYSEDSKRQFSLDHHKQMGMLALKGIDLMDRHSGNLMRHTMTGRPMQLDAGIVRNVTGRDQIQVLMKATSEGFKASGQPDVARIINDISDEFLAQGKEKEAWDFTKEAFANLQKIKRPLPNT